MRRYVLIAGLFIVLGAIVNVLIAWGCAALVNYDKAKEQIIYTAAWDEGGYISDARRTRPGFTQSIRRLKRPDGYGTAGHDYFLSFTFAHLESMREYIEAVRNALETGEPPHRALFSRELPVMLRPGERFREARPGLHERAVKGELGAGLIAMWPWQTSTGWPMRSMACWHENLMGVPSKDSFATVGPVTITRGYPIGVAPSPNEARVIPLQPLWGGFLFNTLLYAVLLAIAFRAAVEGRTRLRLRRGLCPRCKYPIGVSPVCTECGEPIPLSAAPAAASQSSPHRPSERSSSAWRASPEVQDDR